MEKQSSNLMSDLCQSKGSLNYYTKKADLPTSIVSDKKFLFIVNRLEKDIGSKFSWTILSKGEGTMRSTLREVPASLTRPDHNNVPYFLRWLCGFS